MNTNAERMVRRIILLLLLASLGGCAWVGAGRDPVPRQTGLYAVEDGRLQRLDGDQKWEVKTWADRSNLPPRVEFMARHPLLGMESQSQSPGEGVQLSRVAWVRSEITPEGEIGPVDGSPWAVANIRGLQVPFTIRGHDAKKDIVWIIPASPLEHGLYSLHLPTGSAPLNARLGVGWDGVDRRAYSTAHCVDRYVGDPVPYRFCAEQEQVLATKWLRIHLVDPESREVDGQRVVIIRGVVVNTSQRPRKVPMLEAHLRGADGMVLQRWQFPLDTGELAAGASGSFRSEFANPPQGTQNVHVTFAAGSASASGYPLQ